MSVCRRIIVIFLVLLLFESVVGEIHRAKPTWSKNVAGGGNSQHHLHHSQHHRSHLKYSAGSNNVAPTKTDEGRKDDDDDDDDNGDTLGKSDDHGSPRMAQTDNGQKDGDVDHHQIDVGDHALFGVLGGTPTSDFDKGHHGPNREGAKGESIADRFHQQPADLYTWIYTIISASFVGLSGVLPLVVIPLEAGKSLRRGAGYNRLKLFLSFAVGGLLGDVFLHLLPEAWHHVNTSEDFMWIGEWVLAGILSFLFIEKVMGEEDEEEEESTQKDENSEDATECCTEGISNESSIIDHQINHINKSDGYCCHNLMQTAGSEFSTDSKHDNLSLLSEENKLRKDKSSNGQNKKTESIKISGYLNLFANCVDNFTHGLAIAGSYLVSRKVGIITTIAILLHEIPHEVGDFAILLRAGFDRWKAAKAQLLTATGGMLGALTALTAESAEQAGIKTAWILPFTAGGFIYIALVTIVPELVKEEKPRQSLNQIVCILAGIACMLFVTLVFE